MRITSVTYRRLVSFGNYENEAVEATAEVPDHDDPEAVLTALKLWVEGRCQDRVTAREERYSLIDIRHQAEQEERRLREARGHVEKMAAFLKHHGVELHDLPF